MGGPIYQRGPRPARKAAGPPAYGPPAPVYAPAPKYAPAPEPKLPPQPYQFEYGVADQYTGTNFQAVENQDAEGTVIGDWHQVIVFPRQSSVQEPSLQFKFNDRKGIGSLIMIWLFANLMPSAPQIK